MGEIPLTEIEEPREKTGWEVRHFDVDYRRIVGVDLGVSVAGYTQIKLDPDDPVSGSMGAAKRFMSKNPTRVPGIKRRLVRFVRRWCQKNLTPLSPDTDFSLDSWLAQADYPDWRKAELREKYNAMRDIRDDKRYYRCKSFIKDEFYSEYKYPRCINSRSDEFKCITGPIFHAIEQEVFKNGWFIKKVSMPDRPDYILDRLQPDGKAIAATDYTSFEAQFDSELMEACEMELYRYMLRGCDVEKWFMNLIRKVLLGVNFCEFKYFLCWIKGSRMSGEMCTSLGNGFSNLMFMLFTCHEAGINDVRGVVEGDDGLFSLPLSMKRHFPTKEDFENLGLRIKLEYHESVTTASFCGIVFDPIDKANLTDPTDVLVKFGWTNRIYARSRSTRLKQLLRAKAYSLAYQYPGCPVVGALARYGLKITSGITIPESVIWNEDWYYRGILRSALKEVDVKASAPVGPGSRLLVERLWGVSILAQEAVERYLDNLEVATHLNHPVIFDLMRTEWGEFYGMYAHELHPAEKSLNYPILTWKKLPGFDLPLWWSAHWRAPEEPQQNAA